MKRICFSFRTNSALPCPAWATRADAILNTKIPVLISKHIKQEVYTNMENQDKTNLVRIQMEDKEILLLGTAHVSKESTKEVIRAIEEEKPDAVCVELCESRYQTLSQKDRWQNMDIIKVIREKKAFLLLSHLLLTAFQKRIAEKLNAVPGEEMIRAVETAEKNGISVVLADRDIRTTLARTWGGMGLWSKIKIMFQLLFSIAGGVEDIDEEEVERLKQEDMLETLLADVEGAFPEFRRILIDERDRYMSQKIKHADGQKILAVVGAGHVPGIRKYLDTDQDTAELETTPPKKKTAQVIKWMIPILIAGLIGYGFYKGGSDAGKDMVFLWIGVNGFMAGLGAIIAFGHPYTILSSILAAPLTSLNPMIAAGWVSGLVEAFTRKPRVKDLENLSSDILSVKGFWRNKVTRILLVVVFTNLGSSIGTFAAIPFMMRLVQ